MNWFEARAALRVGDLDLPTEAQWETALRGGTTTPWFLDPPPATFAETGWFGERDGVDEEPVAVGGYPANPYGLLDLVGNVSEWCLDASGSYRDARFAPRTGERLEGDPTKRSQRGSFVDLPAPLQRSASRSAMRFLAAAENQQRFLGVRAARALRTGDG